MVLRREVLAALTSGPILDQKSADGPRSSAVTSVADVAALRSSTPSGSAVIVAAYARAGDQGGGAFVRDGTVLRDNGITELLDASRRGWRRLGGSAIDVSWAGAACDGVADDTVAVLHAAALGAIVFSRGVTRLSGHCVFEQPVEVTAGARIELTAGATFEARSSFSAPRIHVFEGSGEVRLSSKSTVRGYPEWWGAKGDDPELDSRLAIQSALDTCRVVELAGADYYTGGPLLMRRHNSSLFGVASNQDGHGGGSRIIIRNAVDDVLRVGFDRPPDGQGTNSHFLEHVTIAHLSLERLTPPLAKPSNDPMKGFMGSPAGLRLSYVVTCYVNDVICIEHSNGFYIEGAVHCYITDCQSIRNGNGANRENDFFNGFFQNNAVNIGYNSGNASLYYRNCSVFASADGVATGGTGSSGLYTYGGFTDTHITGLETGHVQFGVNANGAGSTDAGYSSENLRIEGCMLDSCTKAGVLINEGNDNTAVTITDSYVAAAGAAACVSVNATRGAIAITGCQFLSGPGSAGIGVFGLRSSGISSVNNLFTDISSPIVLKFCSNCASNQDTFNNTRVGCAATGSFWLISSSRCQFRSTIKGRPGISPLALNLTINTEGPDAGMPADYNEVHLSGIDPKCLSSGENGKLTFEGQSIRSSEPFGAAGARHNVATGLFD